MDTDSIGPMSVESETNSETNSGSGTDVESEGSLPDGEISILIQSLEDEVAPAVPEPVVAASTEEDAGLSVYQSPLPVEIVSELMPPDNAALGMVFTATIIPDGFFCDVKYLNNALNKGDFDAKHLVLKPRRPSLPVRSNNFFLSLTKLGPRQIFTGVLNGWPALNCFELLSLEQKRHIRWHKVWRSEVDGAKGVEPSIPNGKQVCRATLRAAPWTSRGWSQDSPGFAFWYERHRQENGLASPRLWYGSRMTEQVEDAKCSQISMVSHRYAVKRESPKDMVTYHSICVLEWEHGRYMTVVETAFLNGIGGYKGKSNWYHDKDAPVATLFSHFPKEMIQPWKTNMAEIRCFDVEAKTMDEFQEYLKEYTGSDKRFLDPRISFSHPARLTFRSKSHIAQYLLNYISRDSHYAELRKNCQTFAADLCNFIAGKRDVIPFHPVNRVEYNNRTHFFLYDSHLFERKEQNQKKPLHNPFHR